MESKIEILTECVEFTCEVLKHFTNSEYLVNDGEVQESMTVVKRGSQLLKTCIKDCYEELTEEYNLNVVEIDEDPSVLNLSSILSELVIAVNNLIKVELNLDKSVENLAKTKIENCLGKIKNLTKKLFD